MSDVILISIGIKVKHVTSLKIGISTAGQPTFSGWNMVRGTKRPSCCPGMLPQALTSAKQSR